MTPDQALQILDEMAAEAMVSRLRHYTAQSAVKTLREALAGLALAEDAVTPSRDGAEEVPVAE